MRMLFRLTLIFILMIIARGQVQGTSSVDSQPLTSTNVSKIQPLGIISNPYLRYVTWSSDGTLLAVTTSHDTGIYSVDDLDAPPVVIDDTGAVHFRTDYPAVTVDGKTYDTRTGRRILSPPISQSGAERRFVIETHTVNEQKVVELHYTTGDIVRLETGGSYSVKEIILSPDEHHAAFVLTYFNDGYELITVQLWNLVDGTMLAEMFPIGEGLVEIRFHSDGKLLAFASMSYAPYGISEDIQIWDVMTGTPLVTEWQLPLEFSRDGRLMAYPVSQGVALWTDHELGVLPLTLPIERRFSMDFSRDSQTMATIEGQNILLWDVSEDVLPATPDQVLPTEAAISRLFYTPDGLRLIALQDNNLMEIWNAATGEHQMRLTLPTETWHADSTWARIASLYGNELRVLNLFTGQETIIPVISTFPIRRPLSAPQTRLTTPDGRFIIDRNFSCGQDAAGRISVFEGQTEELLYSWSTGHSCGVYDQFLTPDGTRLVVSYENIVAILPISDLAKEAAQDERGIPSGLATVGGVGFPNFPHDRIRDITLSPDGKQLAVSLLHENVVNAQLVTSHSVQVFRFFDLLDEYPNPYRQPQLEPAFTIPDAHYVLFGPNSTWLITNAGLWNVNTGQKVNDITTTLAAFSPNGHVLAVANKEKVILWAMETLVNRETAPLAVLPLRDVESLRFSGDGTQLLIVRAGEQQVWSIR
ncbi:MAG: hypothetical protein OHK0046_09770 [Anaerolineae bacterium]